MSRRRIGQDRDERQKRGAVRLAQALPDCRAEQRQYRRVANVTVRSLALQPARPLDLVADVLGSDEPLLTVYSHRRPDCRKIRIGRSELHCQNSGYRWESNLTGPLEYQGSTPPKVNAYFMQEIFMGTDIIIGFSSYVF
ncbi:MAG: hypothetical protein ACK42I_03590 [Thermomicrobium sp.]